VVLIQLVIVAIAWLGALSGIVALCAAAGRADRREAGQERRMRPSRRPPKSERRSSARTQTRALTH
jgi:hypothetical protein